MSMEVLCNYFINIVFIIIGIAFVVLFICAIIDMFTK